MVERFDHPLPRAGRHGPSRSRCRGTPRARPFFPQGPTLLEPCLAVVLHQGSELGGDPPYDSHHDGKSELCGCGNALRRPSDTDPDRQLLLLRTRGNLGVLQRGPQRPVPGDPLRCVELQQQVDLFRKQRVVIGEVIPEERERFDERSSTGNHLRPPRRYSTLSITCCGLPTKYARRPSSSSLRRRRLCRTIWMQSVSQRGWSATSDSTASMSALSRKVGASVPGPGCSGGASPWTNCERPCARRGRPNPGYPAFSASRAMAVPARPVFAQESRTLSSLTGSIRNSGAGGSPHLEPARQPLIWRTCRSGR